MSKIKNNGLTHMVTEGVKGLSTSKFSRMSHGFMTLQTAKSRHTSNVIVRSCSVFGRWVSARMLAMFVTETAYGFATLKCVGNVARRLLRRSRHTVRNSTLQNAHSC